MNVVALCLAFVLAFVFSPLPGETLPSRDQTPPQRIHLDAPMHVAAMSGSPDCPCDKHCMVNCLHAGCAQAIPVVNPINRVDVHGDLGPPPAAGRVTEPTHPPRYRPPIRRLFV